MVLIQVEQVNRARVMLIAIDRSLDGLPSCSLGGRSHVPQPFGGRTTGGLMLFRRFCPW